MTTRPITPNELRRVLSDLVLIAAPFARRCGKGSKDRLRATLSAGNAALRAADAPQNLDKPEAMVAAFIEAGGDWHALAAAVNAAALEGSTRRKR